MTEIILGGGCFWCLDAVFRDIKGVESSECGYAGGTTKNPTYEEVSTGETGHAEVIRLRFSETTTSLETLLDLYFLIHDPTTLNRQGADMGSQYRSVMLYKDPSQKEAFEASVKRAQAKWDTPIVTTIEPLDTFYLAEPEHQNYFANHPESGYCQIVISPKLIKARAAFKELFVK